MNKKPIASQSASATIVLLVAAILLLSVALLMVVRSTDTDVVDVPFAPPSTSASKLTADKLAEGPSTANAPNTQNGSTTFTRTVTDYTLPDVRLLNSAGTKVALTDELNHDGPVMMQFIFTTCPTICPVMSATFAAAQDQLGTDAPHVRMVSISIDPEQDTPARLREYSQRFRAPPQWRFLTGSRDSIAAVQKAFDAYQDNKMRHAPLTYLRASTEHPWVRIDGLLSAQEMLAELFRAPTAGSTSSVEPASTVQHASCDCDAEAMPGNPELGKRIYHDGILPSGKPLRAVTLGDVVVEGTQVHCASCHRRSGFAGGEETIYVPPINGPTLYKERQLNRGDLFRKLFQDTHSKATAARVRDLRHRPAYSDETLATAIRHGVDPTGRQLDLLMPRYQLGDEDVGHLVAYLKSLFNETAPGVDESTIHFATVVCEGVPDSHRQAMMAVLNAYVRRKNADTQGKLHHPGFSPLYKDEFQGAFREWKLHIWDLHGSPESWGDQLDSYYRTQPVFALLSGMGAGSWSPVHDFCERTELPCLFPHVDLPAVTGSNGYSLYLSKGLTVEAEALARHLVDNVSPVNTERVVQVYRDDDRGRVPAAALRRALHSSAIRNLKDREIDGTQLLTVDFWRKLAQDEQPSVLVLWLEDRDLDALSSVLENVRRVYLSHSFLQAIPPVEPARLCDKIHMTYQFTLSGSEVPRIYRVRAWMRSRRIALTHEPIQLNTFFALSITDHALVHLVENFSRDYLIESIEHETENALNPGVFPHLSLGPGQRFASKGSYIVKLPAKMDGEIQAVSDWIVP